MYDTMTYGYGYGGWWHSWAEGEVLVSQSDDTALVPVRLEALTSIRAPWRISHATRDALEAGTGFAIQVE